MPPPPGHAVPYIRDTTTAAAPSAKRQSKQQQTREREREKSAISVLSYKQTAAADASVALMQPI